MLGMTPDTGEEKSKLSVRKAEAVVETIVAFEAAETYAAVRAARAGSSAARVVPWRTFASTTSRAARRCTRPLRSAMV